jgi:ribosomal protein S18 acetylase RimI-like enzyme
MRKVELQGGLEPKIQIRYAVPSDLPEVSSLFRDVLSGLPIYNERARRNELARFCEPALETMLSADSKAISVATIHPNKATVGFCITVHERRQILIEWFGTQLAWRRVKIGHALIDHLIAEAQSRRATRIWSSTRINNLPSMALLQNLGFRQFRKSTANFFGHEFYDWERMV